MITVSKRLKSSGAQGEGIREEKLDKDRGNVM